jgi:PRTRC genetic system protein D
MTDIIRVGLDVGFGDTKVARLLDGKFETVSFPSVLGQAQDLARYSAGLGATAQRRAVRMIYDGVEYYVGRDALRHSRTLAGRQDRARIGSVEERVLALAALAQLGVDDAYIVTGLPILWFDDRARLMRSLKGEHRLTWGKEERTIRVHGVLAIPQPFGGFYWHFLDDAGKATVVEAEMLRTYAFFDIGWNTTDLSAINELQPKESWSGGERVGMRNVIEIVGDQVQRRLGLELPPHELDAAIRARQVEVYGKFHSIADIVDSATASVGQQVVAVATRLWGNGERMTKILVFGGGAAVLGAEIRKAFSHNSVVLPNPAMANALGFCRFAQRRKING